MAANLAGMRVLVAEDHRPSAAALRRLLEWHGCDVRVAADGPMALAIAEEFSPQLALLDFNMPELNGGQVARRLRAMESRPLLVAVTATLPESELLAEYRDAFDAWLFKPVEYEALLATLRQVPHAVEES